MRNHYEFMMKGTKDFGFLLQIPPPPLKKCNSYTQIVFICFMPSMRLEQDHDLGSLSLSYPLPFAPILGISEINSQQISGFL